MNEPKLWTKDFLIDGITNLIVYLVYYLLIVAIGLHAVNKLHASSGEAGLACGIFVIAAVISRSLTGRAIEQVGRKKMLCIGLCFYVLTTLLYFGASNLALLIVIRFLHGVGFGISGTATGTIAASIIPGKRRGEGISYYAMSATLASAIGPSIALILTQRGNFNAMLMLAAILLSISAIGVIFMKVPEVELTQEQQNELKGFKLNNLFEPKAIPISIVSIFAGIGISSILGFMNSYTREINLVSAGSIFFIIYAVAILISRPLTGRWFDQKGENYVMYPSFILFALGLTVLSQAHKIPVLLLAGIICGLGYGTFLSGAQAIAIKVSPAHRMGLATSTFFSLIDGGVGIGPFILGCLTPLIGLREMYVVTAVIVFAGSFFYYFLHGKNTGQLEAAASGSSVPDVV